MQVPRSPSDGNPIIFAELKINSIEACWLASEVLISDVSGMLASVLDPLRLKDEHTRIDLHRSIAMLNHDVSGL